MIILLKSDKSLIISKTSRLYQKENAVDQIVFYIPEKYDDYDLSNFTVTLYYVNQGNTSHIEILTADEDSDKDGFLKYKLPVTTRLTEFAGEITMHLSLTFIDLSVSKKYVLHSDDIKINIETWEDYFKFVSDDSITAIDDRILEIDNEIQKLKDITDRYKEVQPDDLTVTDNLLQLTANGTVIGDGVEILTNPSDTDGESADGMLDLDEIQTEIPDETKIVTVNI